MSRRPVNPSRRYGDGGGGGGGGGGGAGALLAFNSKSRSAPGHSLFLRICTGAQEDLAAPKGFLVRLKVYVDSMHKVLHIGPDTCSVVSLLLKEKETEAWGVEPYDIEDVDGHCQALVRKGIVRVADIKFPLPYRPKSFSLVIVSDALDYLSPRYLNKMLPDLARVSTEGLVIFADAGFPGQQRAKVSAVSKFGKAAKLRSSSWWARYFIQTSLDENEAVIKKFEQAAAKKAYEPSCRIFPLKAYN